MAAQQQVIDYGNTANDGQGDPLRDAFIKVDDNFANLWDAGPVGSNIQIVNNTIGVTNTNGNLILAPNGTGVVQTNNHILPRIDSVYSLGSPDLRFRSAYVGYGGLYVTGNLTIDGTIFGNINLGSPIVADLRGSVIADDGVTVLVNAVSKSLYATSANITGNLSAGNLSGVLTTSAQPNITSVGTLSLLNVTGNLSANNVSGRITTASQPNITSVGNLSSLAVTGNVTTSGYFVGDGSKLSNLSVTGGTSIINGNSNVVVAANSSVSVGVAGVPNVAVFNASNVVVNGLITATGNVSGTYILGNGAFLTGLPANYGNANVADYLPTYTGNLNPGNVTAIGNITAANINTSGITSTNNFVITGEITGNLIPTANVTYDLGDPDNRWKDLYLSGNSIYIDSQVISANAAGLSLSNTSFMTSLAVSGNATVGNLSTSGLITAIGNVTAGNVNTAGSSTVTGNIVGGNINTTGLVSATGNVTGGNVITAGLISATGNAIVGNINTAGVVTAIGNIIGGNLIGIGNVSGTYILGNGAFLTGLPESYGNANVANYLPTYSGNLNSVSAIPGSAVTGTVALANIAYSVDVANVSGIGNIATINLDGNVANVLRGDGSFAPEGQNLNANYANFAGEAFNVSGANVSGEVANAAYANIANLAYSVAGANVSGQVANALIAGTVYINAQPNITSVGTLSNLTVTSNITGGNILTTGSGGDIVGTGNITGGNLISIGNVSGTYILGNGAFLTGLPESYGNANVANYLPTYSGNLNSVSAIPGSAVTGSVTLANVAYSVAGANVSGEVANAAYANISGISYSVAGANVSGQVANALISGTVYTNAQPNITSVGTLTSLDVSGNANLGNIGANNAVFTGAGSFGANLSMNSNWINSIGYPSAPTDAASKAYVDTMISSGLAYHPPVYVATTSNLAIATSGTTAYFEPNGAGNGVGSYISTTGTFLLIDSANVQTVGTRILVKDEANAAWNGVYTYANTTSIVRSTDADEYGPDSTEQLSVNDFFFTTGGTVNEGVGFVVSAPSGNITFGTSNIVFSIFTTSQVYDAGTGLTLTGTSFSISNTAVTASSYGGSDSVATFTVNQQGQLTTAANVAIAANAANLTGTTLASSVVNSSLTSVGTLANLVVSGNVSAGNADLGNTATANYFVGNGAGLSDIQGSNVSGQVANALIAGTVYTNAQPNITSVGTLSNLTVTSNISGGNILTTGSGGEITGTGNITGGNLISIGNVSGTYILGNGTFLTGLYGNANVANYLPTYSGNLNSVSAIPGSAVTGTVALANIAYSVAGANVSGEVANAAYANISGISYSVSGANVSGEVANAAYANISGIAYSVNVANVSGIGNIATINLDGNIANILHGDGSWGPELGNLNANYANFAGEAFNVSGANVSGEVANAAYANISGIAYSVAGANVSGEVANAAYANISGISYSVAGANVSGEVANAAYANISGIAYSVSGANVSGQVANALIAGTVYTNAQPNITSVGTLSNLTVTSNISGGNILTTGSGGEIVGTGNITGGNLISIGNVSGTYILGNGAFLTGLPEAYGNANVANYLPTYSGNLNNVSAIPGSAVTGSVVLANIANVAYSVAGANVSGEVANAAYANISGIAYSVAGANVSGQVANALISGTVYTNAQPNITSVGTLTSLDVSGNANIGNIGANNAVFTGAGSFGANVNMNSSWINNIGYPSAPTDAASKAYVDTMVSSGLAYHPPVYVATTSNLAIATSGTTAYVEPSGAGNGVGSYISTTGAFLLIDSANVQTVGTRILVKDEANAAWNGVYTYANTTAIIRATDADEYGPDSTEQLSVNDFFFTQGGIVNEGVGFVVSAPQGTITFGTSNIVFSIFTTSQVYDAGTGLTLTGTTFSISNTAVTAQSYGNGDSVPTFTVNQQGQLTAAANVAITANAANLTGTTLASSVVNSSLTSVGTLANLTVSGNASVGNLTITGAGGAISVTGNITGGNLISTGNVIVAGGINVANSFGTLGQVLTSTGANGATWSSQFYVGNAPPQAQSITPNYGDLWYYIGDDGVNTLYVWLTDGSSDYFFDLLPPVFIN